MGIFFSEDFRPLKEALKVIDKQLLKHLCESENLEISPPVDCKKLAEEKLPAENYSIRFTNYCGYLNKEQTHLVIPGKLIDLWGLNPHNKDELKEDFNQKFENFLWKVINELGKLNLLFTLSPASFPVEETPKEENL